MQNPDGLFRWALRALPARNKLDDTARAVLDSAFPEKAEELGADPELLVAFAPARAGAARRRLRLPFAVRSKRPFESCRRRPIPNRLRAEIMLRQEGRCVDCGTRLIIGFFVFDHRPPLALWDEADNANDKARLAAICWTCNEQKTPKDLKEIARTKRLAEAHQDFLERQRDKVPGRRVPSRSQVRALERSVGQKLGPSMAEAPADQGTARVPGS